ncbi:MAG: metallophosphoesterase [Clostridiales bacterium]|nr:metallophosphoesterase [Clostridiales bacterium]
MKRIFKHSAALFLSAAIIISCLSIAFASQSPELTLSSISDMHYMPREFIGSPNGYNYRHYIDSDCRLAQYSDEILDAALDNIIASGTEYLLISGDMSLSSQLQSHKNIASKLREARAAGVKAYVIPGNHDISMGNEGSPAVAPAYVVDEPGGTVTVAGVEYAQDRRISVEGTTKSQFAQIYDGFGFGSDSTVIARDTTDANSLSYVAQLDDSHRLIAIDASIYNGELFSSSQALEGDLLEWVKEQISDCIAAGDTPIAMMHYDLIEKYKGQSVLMGPNFLNNHNKIAAELAGCGLNYLFTGHSHANDISSFTAGGNTLFEICTGGLLLYQSPVRYVRFTGGDAEFQTRWLESIEGIPDYDNFCKTFFRASVRTVMRHRVIIDVSEILARPLSKYISYEKAHEITLGLMQEIIDYLLDMKLTENVSLCNVLEEAYYQHYYGDEIYPLEIKEAIANIKNGDAFDKALPVVINAIGNNTGVSKLLSGVSPELEAAINKTISTAVTSLLSDILGFSLGSFVENIFIDPAPSDNNIIIINGCAYNSASGEQETFGGDIQAAIIKRIFEILMPIIEALFGF